MTEIESLWGINENAEVMKWLFTCIEMASYKPGICLFISIWEGLGILKMGNQFTGKAQGEKHMFGCYSLVGGRGIE